MVIKLFLNVQKTTNFVKANYKTGFTLFLNLVIEMKA